MKNTFYFFVHSNFYEISIQTVNIKIAITSRSFQNKIEKNKISNFYMQKRGSNVNFFVPCLTRLANFDSSWNETFTVWRVVFLTFSMKIIFLLVYQVLEVVELCSKSFQTTQEKKRT